MTSGITRTNNEIEVILNNFGYKLIKTYKKVKNLKGRTRIVIKNSFGYKFDTVFSDLVQNNGNLNFVDNGNPYSIENISKWLKINKKNFKIYGKNNYVNKDTKLNFYCFSCKDVFSMGWNEIRNGQNCAICRGIQVGKKHSLAYLRKDLLKDWSSNNNISPKQITVGSSTSVFWNCKKCGNVYSSSPYKRSIGEGCYYCSGRRVSKSNNLENIYPEISAEWDYDKNYPFTPNDFTWGSGKPAHWICSKCGHKWKTNMIADRTSGEKGCPNCRSSHGEKRIYSYLEKMGMSNGKDFYLEKKFPNCKNERTLPFDFYIPKLNLLIEYNGEQHYKPLKIFGGEKRFFDRLRNDSIKRKFCKKEKIELLEISYLDFDNIEKILSKQINKYTTTLR